MVEHYILVRSVTYAQKASAILTGSGIANKVVRKPRGITVGGCGYAVRVNGGMPAQLSSLLIDEGTPDFRIFASGDGRSYYETNSGY